MTFTAVGFDVFLLIYVRITAFVFVAPFFSLKNIPLKMKAGFTLFFSLIIFQITPITELNYQSVIDFTVLLINEAMVGLIIGFFTNVSYYILSFAGSIVDMDIGFSMVSEFDPTTNIQTTITSNYYTYLVMLMMLVTNLHHYIITAFADAFKIIPVGKVIIKPDIYLLMGKFMKDYFIIGFRIVFPVFASVLLLNSILAILAKIAPQMNMFVIGMQLKVLVGLVVLFLLVAFIPNVTDFIFNEMMDMMKSAITVLS